MENDKNRRETADNSGPDHSENAPLVYDRLLEKVYLSVENLDQKSWDFIRERIEEAAEVELAAEEMTRDEMDLLKAYLARDLKDLGVFAHKTGEGIAAWLKFDLNMLEQRAVEMLMSLADKTRLEQTELQQRLDHGSEDYLAGEVAAAGTLRCLSCGELMRLRETTLIQPCHACDSRYFHRDSGLWQ